MNGFAVRGLLSNRFYLSQAESETVRQPSPSQFSAKSSKRNVPDAASKIPQPSNKEQFGESTTTVRPKETKSNNDAPEKSSKDNAIGGAGWLSWLRPKKSNEIHLDDPNEAKLFFDKDRNMWVPKDPEERAKFEEALKPPPPPPTSSAMGSGPPASNSAAPVCLTRSCRLIVRTLPF